MINDILEILQQHKLGHIPEEQALKELCILFGVIPRLCINCGHHVNIVFKKDINERHVCMVDDPKGVTINNANTHTCNKHII